MAQDQKCQSLVAEHFVNDLFEMLEIKGSNQRMFDQFCKLLMRFPETVVKDSWKDIVFSCNLPNGQLAGTMPKLEVVEKILRSKNSGRFEKVHSENKKEIVSEGVFKTLWKVGLEYSEGKISKQELLKKIDEM